MSLVHSNLVTFTRPYCFLPREEGLGIRTLVTCIDGGSFVATSVLVWKRSIHRQVLRINLPTEIHQSAKLLDSDYHHSGMRNEYHQVVP